MLPSDESTTKSTTGSAAARASLWSGADGVIRALIGFSITIVLARLVSPSEFGIVAMILVFSAVAGVLIDSGLGTALIQRQDATHADESAVFYFTLAISMVMAVTLALGAPWIADFFVQPDLTVIARIMAINLVIGALGAIHTTLLMKELNFRPLLFIGLWSIALSGALAIVLAWYGYGAWSLVWQVLAQTTISTLLLWLWYPWRPLPAFDRSALRRLMIFGGPVLASKLIDTLYNRLYSVLIGKLFSPADLGFYTRAQSTQQLPTNLLTNTLNRVAFPAFSRAAKDPKRLSTALVKTTRLLMFVNLPVMAGLALVASPAVEVLFGQRWMPVVPLLQALCVVGALWPLQVLNLSALIAQGHSRLLLKIELLKKVVGIAALLISIPFGLVAIAWGQAAASVIAFLINSWYSGRFLAFGAAAQLLALRRVSLATVVMAGAVLAFKSAYHLHPLAELVLFSSVGASVYLCACWLIRERSLQELIAVIRAPIEHFPRTPVV